jgi:hypothetical protein
MRWNRCWLTIKQVLSQNEIEGCARNKRQMHLDYQTIVDRIGSEVNVCNGEWKEDEGGVKRKIIFLVWMKNKMMRRH